MEDTEIFYLLGCRFGVTTSLGREVAQRQKSKAEEPVRIQVGQSGHRLRAPVGTWQPRSTKCAENARGTLTSCGQWQRRQRRPHDP